MIELKSVVSVLGMICLFLINGHAQSAVTVNPVLNLQMWTTYTADYEIYDENLSAYTPVDNRLNFHLHRSRIGLKGKLGNRLKYSMITSIDFVGKDILSGAVGGSNNGASPTLRLWNTSLDYKALASSDLLNIRFGYFTPAVSRESITSPFKTNGFEKSWTQNYIRRHMTGTGPGRVLGVNFGGLQMLESTPLSFSYDVGIFNPVYNQLGGNSSGIASSNILTYRVVVHIGDPEMTVHGSGRKNNYGGQRKGISLAWSQSYQGKADTWTSNTLYSFDVLANYGPIGFMMEWASMNRAHQLSKTQSHTWVIRGFYDFTVDNRDLELVLSRMEFNGPMSQLEQDVAMALGAFYGEDSFTELNLNTYVNDHIKIAISYTWRDGAAGFYDSPGSGNNFFVEGGAPPIKRGDYLGIGFNFIL